MIRMVSVRQQSDIAAEIAKSAAGRAPFLLCDLFSDVRTGRYRTVGADHPALAPHRINELIQYETALERQWPSIHAKPQVRGGSRIRLEPTEQLLCSDYNSCENSTVDKLRVQIPPPDVVMF